CWRITGASSLSPELFDHLQLYTRSLILAHLLGNLYHERSTLERIGSTVLEDIADYIAIRVGVAILGFIAHIRAHGFGATESRTFANQQNNHIRFDEFADIVHHTNSCILDEERCAKS